MWLGQLLNHGMASQCHQAALCLANFKHYRFSAWKDLIISGSRAKEPVSHLWRSTTLVCFLSSVKLVAVVKQEVWHIPQDANPRRSQQAKFTACVYLLNYYRSFSPLLSGQLLGCRTWWKLQRTASLWDSRLVGWLVCFSHHGTEVLWKPVA